MEIDPHSHVPLHAQVEQAVLKSMANGVLPAGARLPAEERLIERFGVSRTTIRTAIQSLLAQGLVEIRRGKGTFVTQPTIAQELTELTGFVEDMRASGREPSALVLDRRVVAACRNEAPPPILQPAPPAARTLPVCFPPRCPPPLSPPPPPPQLRATNKTPAPDH